MFPPGLNMFWVLPNPYLCWATYMQATICSNTTKSVGSYLGSCTLQILQSATDSIGFHRYREAVGLPNKGKIVKEYRTPCPQK